MVRISLPVIVRPKGYVLYEGPSRINGENIVVVATLKSENEKTGNMVQIWILVSDNNPLDANRAGEDSAVCGNCKHRHFRSCYVNLGHGPLFVWRAWKDGKYPRVELQHATSELFRDRFIRLGAYGDPAAVPIEVWDCITKVCAGWLGYTHQWKRKGDRPYRKYCMASCDTIKEARKAMRNRWKPFYVRQQGEEVPAGFFVCPASAEAGKHKTCQKCRACKGGTWNRKQGLPTILAHGVSWKQVYFARGMKLMENHEKYVGVFNA